MIQARRSWQVRLASVLVGLGAVAGIAMIVLAFALMRGDPGFLFAVLPIVFVFLTVAGLGIASFSWALVVRLRRATPGVRMQVAVLGGCLAASGAFSATGSAPAGACLVLHGAALVWLMTTSAAARDLGAWMDRPPRRAWFARSTAATPSPPPRPWWETWQAGLAQGMPLWELALVGAALLAFAVGLAALPLGLALVPAIRSLSLPLIALAIGVVWFVERRMRARLAGR